MMEKTMNQLPVAFFCIAILAATPIAAMDLKSSDVADGGPFRIEQLYAKCDGSNLSPVLSWSGVPPKAKSLGAALPAGAVSGENDFGEPGYGGPCPPPGSGPHHYDITVWALNDAYPPLGSNLTGLKVGTWLQDHAIDKARITGVYER
jgi:phosphatidylethanolamine-binding protein (PEBP) family uncharacterized protein